MQEKEKTRPSGSSTETGATGDRSRTKDQPQSQTTTATPKAQPSVEDFLRRGEENAISSRRLLELTGIRTARALRLAVAAERQRGALILSGDAGYYLPAFGRRGREEMHRFVRCILAKAASTRQAARPALEALRELDGQMQMGVDDAETENSEAL